MKGVVVILVMTLFLSGLVFAVGSEITSDFSVNSSHQTSVANYVPQKNVSSGFFEYSIVLFVLLLFVYLIARKVAKKSPKRKKPSSARKRKRK